VLGQCGSADRRGGLLKDGSNNFIDAPCYSVAFDYDERQYTINETEKKEFPAGVKMISVVVERV